MSVWSIAIWLANVETLDCVRVEHKNFEICCNRNWPSAMLLTKYFGDCVTLGSCDGVELLL